MSTTTELACRTCHKRLWVGQSRYLYTTDRALEILNDFLQTHRTTGYAEKHELVFTDDHNYEVMEFAKDERPYEDE